MKALNIGQKNFLIFSIITAIFLTACSDSKYTIDISNMPKGLKQNHEKILNENIEIYKNSKDDDAKFQAAGEIAFRYMQLGQYDKAISYYERFLKQYPADKVGLNNMAVIYETVNENLKALEYQQKVYEIDPLNPEVVADTLRLLLKNDKISDANGVLQTFAIKATKSESMTTFISDQFKLIQKAQNP